MKTYKIYNKEVTINPSIIRNKVVGHVEFTEDEIRDIIKNNPELLTPTPTHKRKYFVPKKGEIYWHIYDDGILYSDYYDSEGVSNIDMGRFMIGNSFETKQDAQDELNRRQALVRIWNNYDDKYSWDIDWDNVNQDKYGMTCDMRNKTVQFNDACWCKTSTELPYFKSAEDRNQFVEENKSDLKLIFNIK